MNVRERNNSVATGQSPGKLIVLEGCDDVGKSTIAKQIAERSTNKCVVVSFPGQELGSLGEWVYDLHHASKTKSIDPTSLQLLHVAAHIECINSQVKPLLAAGCIVVLDRFWWSTWAYGIVSGVDQPSLK